MTNLPKIQFGISPIQSTPHRRALLAFAGALAFASGATTLLSNTSPVVAAGVHCNADVSVTNNKGASIKVLNFKYKIGSGAVYTEELSNEIVMPGKSYTWKNQSMNNAATGVVITDIALEYKDDTGKGYGPAQKSPWVSRTHPCDASSNYHQVIN
jgi:hypothetical protein